MAAEQGGDSKSGNRALSGGLTKKIVALVDALGNLIKFCLLPGQRHDLIGVNGLLEGLSYEALIADKAFDSDDLRQRIADAGADAVIPPRRHRKTDISYDKDMYKWRHLVENFFCKIKEFRRIATRYDKTDTSYAGFLNLVASMLCIR